MASALTLLDSRLARDVTFQFRSKGLGTKSGFNVRFQFPPRILSDSRKGDWVEGPLRGDEPVAVYATSGAREITMAWTYIAGAKGFGGLETADGQMLFTPYIISRQLQGLRGYFSGARRKVSFDQNLVVYFRMWYHTGVDIFTCRLRSIDVVYSNCLVNDVNEFRNVQEGRDQAHKKNPQIGNPTRTYALRTDITVDMRLWSKVGQGHAFKEDEYGKPIDPTGGIVGRAEAEQIEGIDPKIDLPSLLPIVPPDWQ